jgi:hypothetical protein
MTFSPGPFTELRTGRPASHHVGRASFLLEADFRVVELETHTVNALAGWNTEVTVTTPKNRDVDCREHSH